MKYLPAPGSIHFFMYKWHPCGFLRQQYKHSGNLYTDHREKLVIFSWKQSVIRSLLDVIQKEVLERKYNKIQVFQGLQDGEDREWTSCKLISPRPLSRVIMDPLLKTELIKELKGYLHPSGTGKSSLCHALASLTGLDIYTVSLNSWTITGDALYGLFSSLPDRCIVLFEDIDQAGIEKRGPNNNPWNTEPLVIEMEAKTPWVA